jgi:hypothetical protein
MKIKKNYKETMEIILIFFMVITVCSNCNENEFNCNFNNNNNCINLNQICDGIINCPNGVDEGDFCVNQSKKFVKKNLFFTKK